MPTDAAVLEAELRNEVLPLFRTRAELFRWRPVGEYAAAAREGVEQLRDAADDLGAGPVIPFVQKAIGPPSGSSCGLTTPVA